MGDEDDYLTPAQAAKILHVSRRTVLRWIDQGRIPCFTMAGTVRILSTDLRPAKKQAP